MDQVEAVDIPMTKDDLADERAALEHAKSVSVESAATEVVSIGRVLFKDGEPCDPDLRYSWAFDRYPCLFDHLISAGNQ